MLTKTHPDWIGRKACCAWCKQLATGKRHLSFSCLPMCPALVVLSPILRPRHWRSENNTLYSVLWCLAIFLSWTFHINNFEEQLWVWHSARASFIWWSKFALHCLSSFGVLVWVLVAYLAKQHKGLFHFMLLGDLHEQHSPCRIAQDILLPIFF